MIPVFETERFKREANRLGLGSFAQELRRKFMQNPDPDLYFERRINSSTWYDIRRGKGHIVGRMKTIEIEKQNYSVFCLLRIIGFDSPDRIYIVGEQAKTNIVNLRDHIDENDLRSFVKNWLIENDEKDYEKAKLLPLPSEYLPWLQPPMWFPAGALDPLDLIVYETEEWRKGMISIKDHWAEIHTALHPFLWDEPPSKYKVKSDNQHSYEIETKRQIVIFCSYFSRIDGSGNRRLLMLDSAYDKNLYPSMRQDQTLCNGIESHTLNSVKDVIDHLARQAKRAYPGYFLDRDAYEAWKVIESDEDANLAMSPEEEVLLTRLTEGSGEGTSTPAFINGRAGSGKSTVLYYLFAHYWMYGKKSEKPLPGNPYFITLSGRLLESARNIVKSIIDADCRYLTDQEDKRPMVESLDGVFLPFRSLLLEILPKSRHKDYSQDREINFDTFRRLLLRETVGHIHNNKGFRGKLARPCSPELCWHVIRSYIKGFSQKGLMDIGSYIHLPEEDRSVEGRDFQIVFENVWPWYRSLTVEGEYWDQQDLAREVLNSLRQGKISLPPHLEECVAVFCDEAQDLTGVELKIVLHLSVFSRYDLSAVQGLHNIPFAFAGDPMQTLNPTGFRWENLTSSFYRNLLVPLKLQRPVSKSELHFNYRSPRLITNLANLIQFHRRALFHESFLKPQRPWSLSDGVPPTRYRIPDSARLTENEAKSLQDSFFLLPCEEGSETEYARSFPFLANLMETPNPPEIMSVMTAKGLDLKKVVVFGFGQTLFSNGLPRATEEDMKFSQNIGLAYALNKLYVAVTRSTDELLVMDTENGHKMLWDRLLNRNQIDEILRGMGEEASKQWEEVLPRDDVLPVWDSANFFAPLNVSELIAQAEGLMKSGLELLRADFMEKAGAFYRKAGRIEEEKKCRAYALWFSGHYREASKEFQELKMVTEAVECLWRGKEWSGLVAMGESVNKHRMALARFMVSNLPPVNQLESFLDEFDSLHIVAEPPSVPQWQEVIDRLVQTASKVVKTTNTGQSSLLFRLTDRMIEFDRMGHENCLRLAAEGLALLGEWQKARDVLDKMGPLQKTDCRNLILAHTERWPEYIKPCKSASLGDLLLSRWIDDNKPLGGMSFEGANYLFDTLLTRAYTKEAIQVAFSSFLLKKLVEIRHELNLDERVKMVILSISKDRSVLNLEEEINEIWPRRHEILWRTKLDLYELLCGEGDWGRVADMTAEMLASDEPRLEEFNWICDAIAANSSLGHLPGTEYDEKIKIPGLLFQIAEKFGGDWPSDEVDLLRLAAALETFGLDKHITWLGKTYSESDIRPVRELSRRIYERGRALYHERLSRQGQLNELAAAVADTEKQLRHWGIQKTSIEAGSKFYPPARIEIDLVLSPFRNVDMEAQEFGGFWIVESPPYSIQVIKGKNGSPTGVVEVNFHKGRRPKILIVDLERDELELSDETPYSLSSLPEGEFIEDIEMGAKVKVHSKKGKTEVTVYLPPWPDGVKMELPRSGK